MASGWVGTWAREPGSPGFTSCALAARPRAGFSISPSFGFLSNPCGVSGRITGAKEAKLPPRPFPSSCPRAEHSACPSEAAGFKSAPGSHLRQSCLSPLVPSPHAQRSRVLSVAVEAVMGCSGPPLPAPWGGDRVAFLRGERENKLWGKNKSVGFNLPSLELLIQRKLFLIIEILETQGH